MIQEQFNWQRGPHWNLSTIYEQQDWCWFSGVRLWRITRTRKTNYLSGKSKVVYSIEKERKEYSDLKKLIRERFKNQ